VRCQEEGRMEGDTAVRDRGWVEGDDVVRFDLDLAGEEETETANKEGSELQLPAHEAGRKDANVGRATEDRDEREGTDAVFVGRGGGLSRVGSDVSRVDGCS
jgi:hypothetical protein